MRYVIRSALPMLLLAASAGAAAQAPCPLQPAAPPPVFTSWAKRVPIRAATGVRGLGRALIVPGHAVDLTLSPAARVRLPLAAGKAAPRGSHGGLAGLTIAENGTYRMALGRGAWIDVVGDGQAVASTAHGHGPACTGIAKMVDFPLVPGRYVVQLSGSAAADLPLMVAKVG